MRPDVAARCRADAAASPLADPAIAYPAWYLRRWHFLPEGYLSRRSAVLYDSLIRTVYNTGSERRIIRALVGLLRRKGGGQDTLELGCGPGRALAAAREHLPHARLTGVDLSPFMLELARDRLAQRGVELLHADACALPLSSGAFPAITATHFFGHLPRDVAAAAFAEARRVLSRDGRLYVVDHSWHPRQAPGFRSVGTLRLLRGMVRIEAFQPD